MTNINYLILIVATLAIASCGLQSEKPKEPKSDDQRIEASPREMLNRAYQLFKEGNDEESVKLANRVLEIGRATKNDTLIGKALTSLCRNSQRKLDTARLAQLSAELVDLAASRGNQTWLMYRAHMNAEMWRLIGDMDRAEDFYNESLKISFETSSLGMYTIEHFNKSFVSIAKGDFDTAKELIKKYYQLRRSEQLEFDDAYGLIALSYFLEQQKNYEGAHEVAAVTRRLFKEQQVFPEPPDEKPLLMVESKVKEMLEPSTLDEISKKAASESVSTLLDKYLN